MRLFDNNDTLVFALGGLGEVGKNMYCVECGNEIIITDVGITFPSGELPGVDYIIPDFSYLKKMKWCYEKSISIIISNNNDYWYYISKYI